MIFIHGERWQYKARSIAGPRPPLHVHATARNRFTELHRYMQWKNLRERLYWHRPSKQHKTLLRVTHGRVWVDFK